MLLFVSWGNKFVIIEWPPFDAPTSTHGVFTSVSLSRCCCLHFCRNKFGLMLAQGYFKVQRSSIIHILQLFMTFCDMQSSSGNYSMCHQVPMGSLLLLVYLSAVSYISVEMSLGSCWCGDILSQLTKSNILWFVLDLWPLKILAPTWTQIYFFQKCKQQYWDKLNEVKTPWVLVGAASSKHIKSAYRTTWTFIWPLMYCALALKNCLENYQKYWTNRAQTFFCLFY